jgi:tetratricopeptide (TPR) repeat protein
MAQLHYDEAEQSFQQILEYMPIWPGIDDSDYPINFREIGTAQMGQQHWDAAEESFKKSVSLFDAQIDKALNSDNEFVRTEHVGNLYRGKARSLAYMAVVYLREGRPVEALKTADLAYNVVTQPNVPPKFATEIVQVGRMIAQATGDEDAMAKWSQREPPEK